MGILSWLKSIGSGGGEAAAPLQFEADEQHFHGLDMKAAIEAHIAWKTRLEAQIRGDAGEKLEVGVVAADSNCALGKWIHGDGKKEFGQMPEFEQLRAVHAEFHLCAGSILSDAHNGDKDSAAASLKSALRRNSDTVQLALVRLYAKAKGVH
jgi:hypothetical protein